MADEEIALLLGISSTIQELNLGFLKLFPYNIGIELVTRKRDMTVHILHSKSNAKIRA